MNLSELFIRRPVMTVLLNLAIVLAGVIAYTKIPVAALPSYNTPVINVAAQLPGASPETMATSVALQLEKQFSTIPGLNIISSTNTLGSTSLTLEFDEGRNIDAAAVDVQAALLRQRMGARRGHYMPPTLLDSQLATLEPPADDEHALALDVAPATADVAAAALRGLSGTDGMAATALAGGATDPA